MNKKFILGLVAVAVVVGGYFWLKSESKVRGVSSVTLTASSTTFTLTTSSQRLLATSTKRFAASIQPVNCTTVGTTFINLVTPDAVAVAGTGFAILASSTHLFSDNGDLFVPITSVQGIVNVGTCTVLVTEFKTNF